MCELSELSELSHFCGVSKCSMGEGIQHGKSGQLPSLPMTGFERTNGPRTKGSKKLYQGSTRNLAYSG